MNMKTYILAFTLIALLFSGCDKVENIYPETYNSDLNTALYPGDWNDYVNNEWPDFSTIDATTQRNILLEDFTGHNCQSCPAAAIAVHTQHEQNPERVFVISIHSSPTGSSLFQDVTSQYTVDFTNPVGLEDGIFFGNMAGSGFSANPKVGVSRVPISTGTAMYYAQGVLTQEVPLVLNRPMNVKLKSHVNYYEATKGAFLHTEVEVLDASLTNLGMVVHLVEDSLVAPQNVNGTYTPDYVHRDIHRTNLSGSAFGRTLTSELYDEAAGKYYLNYSFEVPNQLAPQGQTGSYNASNMHLLIYVYDKDTYEILQVVKQHITE